jgi:uncharacterized protein YfaS (alpha-2-macroglobulin family)
MSLLQPEFDYGDTINVHGEFRDPDGVLADPQTVKFSVKKPGSPISTKTFGVDIDVIKDAVGKYHLALDLNVEGVWSARSFSEGTLKAAAEMRFKVKDSDFV